MKKIFRYLSLTEKKKEKGKYMSPVSTLFHTVVTASIVLKSAVRMIASIPQFKTSMLYSNKFRTSE